MEFTAQDVVSIRSRLKLSQGEMASRCGVSLRQVQRWEDEKQGGVREGGKLAAVRALRGLQAEAEAADSPRVRVSNELEEMRADIIGALRDLDLYDTRKLHSLAMELKREAVTLADPAAAIRALIAAGHLPANSIVPPAANEEERIADDIVRQARVAGSGGQLGLANGGQQPSTGA